jgi:O-antigen ligase/Tfp pilus assembly protein PilF
MAKTHRQNRQTQHAQSTKLNEPHGFLDFVERLLHKLTHKNSDEPLAKLNPIDWFAFAAILAFTLIMPFLYSRHTTENFLTPKEFFTKIALGLIGGIYLCRLLLASKARFVATKLDMPMFLFFTFMTFSALYSGNVPSALRDLREVFCVMLLFPILVNLIRSRWQLEMLLWVVALAGIATSMIGVMETYNWYFKFDAKYIFKYVKEEVLMGQIDPNGFYIPLFPQLANPNHGMQSVVSTFGNRNYLGTFAMFTAFIPLSFFFYYKGKFMKSLSLALFALALSGLYVSRCRAALLGIAVGIVFMTVLAIINDRDKKMLRKNVATFVLAVFVIFSGLMYVSVTSLRKLESENIYDKFKSALVLDREKSNIYERLWVWQGNNDAFNYSLGKWLFGNGFGSFKHFFPLQEAETLSDANKDTFTAVTFRQAHNDWIQILSEMGLVGLLLFLFVLYRFFGIIQSYIRRTVYEPENGELGGDQMLVIGLTAALVSQMLAAIPDFPFHRIETAVYAVLIFALMPVLTESDYFSKPMKKNEIQISQLGALGMGVSFIIIALLNHHHELRSWKADKNARSAEMLMKTQQQEARAQAKMLLLQGVALDPLPGDPYLKLATIYEEEKEHRQALHYLDKAWQNINFNARSTYHSVTFRKLHVYYHLLNNLEEARKQAKQGIHLTAGEVRTLYYMYAGKIAADLMQQTNHDKVQQKIYIDEAIAYLPKAAKRDNFFIQAHAALALVYATDENWPKAKESASLVSNNVNQRDPLMLNIIGVAATNMQDYPVAVSALEKAIRLQPNVMYVKDLAQAYMGNGQFSEAKILCDNIKSTKGVDPAILNIVDQMLKVIDEGLK